MIKLTKEEVAEACSYWLRATGYDREKARTTSLVTPIAVDKNFQIICFHTRGGAECAIYSESTMPKLIMKETIAPSLRPMPCSKSSRRLRKNKT